MFFFFKLRLEGDKGLWSSTYQPKEIGLYLKYENYLDEEDYSYAGLPCQKPKCESGRTLVRTEIETLNGCPFYKCLVNDGSDECTKPDCPDGK